MSATDTIKGAITIQAKPAVVFNVIMDFDRYRHWNPWMQRAHRQHVDDPDYFVANHGLLGTVRHQLVNIVEPESIRWNIAGWQRHFVQATREVCIYPASNQATLVTLKVNFTGLALWPAKPLLTLYVRKQAMAELVALKQRCESLGSTTKAPA